MNVETELINCYRGRIGQKYGIYNMMACHLE